jgi:hypothetical protein
VTILDMPVNDLDTDIDWEQIMEEDVPCAYGGCQDPAKWRGTFIPCMHQHNLCNTHKGLIIARWTNPKSRVCAISNIPVTNIKWEPL